MSAVISAAVAPVPLTDWIEKNRPGQNVRKDYSDLWWKEVQFVLDELPAIFRDFGGNTDESITDALVVVGSYTDGSESGKLMSVPVYQLELKDGSVLTFSYDISSEHWHVSFETDMSGHPNFMDIFDPAEQVPEIECEGFPEDRIFGSYNDNRNKFTLKMESTRTFYMFLYIISRQVLR